MTAFLDTFRSILGRTQEPLREIPDHADHPRATDSVWHRIPLGIGSSGEIVWDVTRHPNALISGPAGSGKSVFQRSILLHCLQHKDRWSVLGIDVKCVELEPFTAHTDLVAAVATNVADGVEVLRYARDTMRSRYEQMESQGVNNFQDLSSSPKAVLVMVEEAYMFLAPHGIRTVEGREVDALKSEAIQILGDITRSGRAAGVHIVLSTQRPDATVIGGELKMNLPVRIAAGRMDTIASTMILGNEQATTLPGDVRGRGYVQVDGDGEPFQGYWVGFDDLANTN